MGNRNGCYSVKSGYMVARSLKEDVVIKDPSTSNQIPKSLWKCIWNIAVPPKIQQFLWRIGAGAVATKDALYRRACAKDPMCPLCMEEKETMEHLLFLCPWTKYCCLGSHWVLNSANGQLEDVKIGFVIC